MTQVLHLHKLFSECALCSLHLILFIIQWEAGEREERETKTAWADPAGRVRHSGGHGKREEELPAADV